MRLPFYVPFFAHIIFDIYQSFLTLLIAALYGKNTPMDWNLPNILTLVRLALLPVLVILFFLPFNWAIWTCLILYIFGAFTDFLDGWLARRHNQVSEFGKFLDPVADKIFVATVLLLLIATNRIEGLWTLCVVLILIREFMVSGLREYLAPKGRKLPVTQASKWKTAAQMLAIAFLILSPITGYAQFTGLGLLFIATLLTIYTGWIYLKSGLQSIFNY